MFPKRNNPNLKPAVLTRCDEIIRESQTAMIDNRRIANLWGNTHIILGLTTVFLSSINAVLTFYNQPKIVAVVAILSTISAAFLTFLNPSRREVKRRTAYNKFLSLHNRAKNFRIAINSSGLSEQDMLAKLDDLTGDFEELIQELLKSLD